MLMPARDRSDIPAVLTNQLHPPALIRKRSVPMGAVILSKASAFISTYGKDAQAMRPVRPVQKSRIAKKSLINRCRAFI